MKIKMIDVQTSNKSHAIDICMLVDKIEFLKDIDDTRKKWHFNKLIKLGKLLGNTTLLDFINPLFYSGMSKDQTVTKLPLFNKDIDNLLKKFHRGKNFRNVVLYSLITGCVPEGIYQSCYFDIVTINEEADLGKPENYQYVIVVSPRTEKKELIDVFNNFQQFLKDKINFEARQHDNLVASGNLISDKEMEELKEQAQLIQAEYVKYKEKTINASIDEQVDEYSRFSKRTQPMRNKYEALRHKIPLNMDNPEDVDLINFFHAGPIYESAIIDSGNRRDLERTREWYWMRYKDYLNREKRKPKIYDDLVYEWNNKCPRFQTLKENDPHKKECDYCRIDQSYFVKALVPYEKLLEQK